MSIKAMDIGFAIIEDRYNKEQRDSSFPVRGRGNTAEASAFLRSLVRAPAHPCVVMVISTCYVPSPVPAQALLGTHLAPHTAELRSARRAVHHISQHCFPSVVARCPTE